MPGETVACIVVLDDIIAVTDGELGVTTLSQPSELVRNQVGVEVEER